MNRESIRTGLNREGPLRLGRYLYHDVHTHRHRDTRRHRYAGLPEVRLNEHVHMRDGTASILVDAELFMEATGWHTLPREDAEGKLTEFVGQFKVDKLAFTVGSPGMKRFGALEHRLAAKFSPKRKPMAVKRQSTVAKDEETMRRESIGVFRHDRPCEEHPFQGVIGSGMPVLQPGDEGYAQSRRGSIGAFRCDMTDVEELVKTLGQEGTICDAKPEPSEVASGFSMLANTELEGSSVSPRPLSPQTEARGASEAEPSKMPLPVVPSAEGSANSQGDEDPESSIEPLSPLTGPSLTPEQESPGDQCTSVVPMAQGSAAQRPGALPPLLLGDAASVDPPKSSTLILEPSQNASSDAPCKKLEVVEENSVSSEAPPNELAKHETKPLPARAAGSSSRFSSPPIDQKARARLLLAELAQERGFKVHTIKENPGNAGERAAYSRKVALIANNFTYALVGGSDFLCFKFDKTYDIRMADVNPFTIGRDFTTPFRADELAGALGVSYSGLIAFTCALGNRFCAPVVMMGKKDNTMKRTVKMPRPEFEEYEEILSQIIEYEKQKPKEQMQSYVSLTMRITGHTREAIRAAYSYYGLDPQAEMDWDRLAAKKSVPSSRRRESVSSEMWRSGYSSGSTDSYASSNASFQGNTRSPARSTASSSTSSSSTSWRRGDFQPQVAQSFAGGSASGAGRGSDSMCWRRKKSEPNTNQPSQGCPNSQQNQRFPQTSPRQRFPNPRRAPCVMSNLSPRFPISQPQEMSQPGSRFQKPVEPSYYTVCLNRNLFNE